MRDEGTPRRETDAGKLKAALRAAARAPSKNRLPVKIDIEPQQYPVASDVAVETQALIKNDTAIPDVFISYASEDRESGLAPTLTRKAGVLHAPTPQAVPGARTISTSALVAMFRSAPPTLINVLDWSEGRPVLLGVPTYSDADTGYHDPSVENLEHALLGIHAGLASRPLPANYQGIAIYCDWETDEAEWGHWQKHFMN